MTKNRNLKRRIRAAKPAPEPAAFEEQRPADYLDRIPGSRTGKAYKPLVLEALQLSPGQEVIDVGCGTGVDLNAFAARVGESGSVTGVDIDADALAKARDALAGGEVRLVRAAGRAMPASSWWTSSRSPQRSRTFARPTGSSASRGSPDVPSRPATWRRARRRGGSSTSRRARSSHH